MLFEFTDKTCNNIDIAYRRIPIGFVNIYINIYIYIYIYIYIIYVK